jgi:small subunit ribosomal protein S18
MQKDTETKKTKEPQCVDYKDTAYLRRFINPHGRMMPTRRNNVSARRQREIANAVKRARFMGFLPYISR